MKLNSYLYGTKAINMNSKFYFSILFILGFGSFLIAQVPSKMRLTPADSLFQKFNLNPQDFSDLDLLKNKNPLSEYTPPVEKPNGFKNLMPIIVPNDRFDYKLKIYKPDGIYEHNMPILEPIMIEKYYRS